MVKPKTRPIPYGNTATEVQPGVWEWEAGGFTWQFTPPPGMNLAVVCSGERRNVLAVPNLREAAIFTEGFAAGRESKARG